MRQVEKARAFADLHRPGAPLILFNAWDPGSARKIADAGATAIATGSWSVAAAFGYDDGKTIPLELVLGNLSRIVAAVDLPVSLDFERGYGATHTDVRQSVAAALEAGAIGFNIEDGLGSGLRDIDAQSQRLAAARDAAASKGIPAFINARTDVFLVNAQPHTQAMADEALARAETYVRSGANGVFVPGLQDEGLIAQLCTRSPAPINIMARPGGLASKRLAALGVARISHGPGPYRLAMHALAQAANAAFGPQS
jgi:2-methylisocitrate lyase-like PEP mutase family enzyme